VSDPPKLGEPEICFACLDQKLAILEVPRPAFEWRRTGGQGFLLRNEALADEFRRAPADLDEIAGRPPGTTARIQKHLQANQQEEPDEARTQHYSYVRWEGKRTRTG
jgi:hypothetical protein